LLSLSDADDQIDDDRDVQDQRDNLADARLVDELVGLERQERRGHEDRQPLGPALAQHEAGPLDDEDRGVGQRRDPDLVQPVSVEREDPLDNALDE